MTILFSGTIPIAAGLTNRSAIAVPGGLKKINQPLAVSLSFDGDAIPAGLFKLTIGLSMDGGITFKTATNTLTGPLVVSDLKFSNQQRFGFTLDNGAQVTHLRFTTDAPSAFNLPLSIDAA